MNMKQVLLLHNPGAGDEDHLKSDLVSAIEQEGFGCVYHSVKKEDRWKDQLNQADFVAVAGGDGTVRAVVKELVQRTVLDKKIPLALLPMGTANNLSLTLGIDRDLDTAIHIKNWKNGKLQRFDVGVIEKTDTQEFFLEGTGFGVFPELIQRMVSVDKGHIETAQDELKLALEVLHTIILSARAEDYWIKGDEKIYTGKCILLEVMNIKSVGPNIILSPVAETDDGYFDVVCVDEKQRADFAEYIRNLSLGTDTAFEWKTFKAKKLIIECSSPHMHVDDELILPPKDPLVLEVRSNLLEFLVSG